MTGRELFIQEIEKFISDVPDGMPFEAIEFFNKWKEEKSSKTKEITENGVKILLFMQENMKTYNNIFKASDIAKGLETSGRSVSGSMRKLVSDGYVEKNGKDPVTYSLTEEKGEFFKLTV